MPTLRCRRKKKPTVAIQTCLAVSMALLYHPPPAFAQEAELAEEIVVIGSFIRRDNFNQASPMTQITAMEIEETGTLNMGDVLYNLSAQSGTTPGDTTPFSITNLRGLGAGATMDLMDGHRLLFGDANNTYPQIAIDRVDILLDGASALYGSEAVAGVVNYVPKKRIDGIEFRIDGRAIEDVWDSPDQKWGLIGGFGAEDSNFVFAYEYRKRDEIRQTHDRWGDYIDSRVNRRPPNAAGRLSSSGPWTNLSNPGTFDVPRRDPATGLTTTLSSGLARTATRADPACQHTYHDGGQNFRDQGSWRNGILVSSGKCESNAFNFRTYASDLEQHKAYAYFDHEFSDNLTISAQIVMGIQNETDTNNTVGATGSSRVSNSVAGDRFLVSGTHPGNPFIAMAGGRRLYAQDANGDGIPDRDGDMTSYNARYGGNVILASDPFNSALGVPFMEDVYLDNQYSVIGNTRNPFGGYSRYADDDGNTQAFQHSATQRYQIGLEYRVGDTDWIVNADYILANRQRDRKGTFGNGDESLSAIERGLECALGELQNKCWNPFGTAFFAHDADFNPLMDWQTDPNLINDQEVYDRLLSPAEQQNNYEQDILDIVAAGPLPLEFQGGALSMAVGGHFRREEEEFLPDRLALLEDRTRGSTFKRRVTQSESLDWFFELNAPVMDSDRWGMLELSAAYRDTTNDIDATIPEESGSGTYSDEILKAGIVYQPPVDWVSMRASYGEGFVIPGQFTAFGDKRIEFVTTGVASGDYTCEVLVDDDTTGDGGLGGTAATGVTEALCSTAGQINFRRTTVASPNLQGETSEAYNLGFTLNLLGGDLVIDVDRFEVDFNEQVVYANFNVQSDIYRNSYLTFLQGQSCGSDAACWLNARLNWIQTGEPALQTANLAPGQTPASDAPNNTTGFWRLDPDDPTILTDQVSSYLNLDQNTSVSYDLKMRYSFNAQNLPFIGGDWGSFVANLDATFVEEFTLTPDPTSSDRVNVAGQLGRNEGLQDGGSPRWKGSAGLRWAYGNHVARLVGRYHHHVKDYNVPSFTCITSLSNASCRVDSMTVFDLFYQYRVQDFLGIEGETTIALTVNNLFDRFPDPQETAVTPWSASLDRAWGRFYNIRFQHTF